MHNHATSIICTSTLLFDLLSTHWSSCLANNIILITHNWSFRQIHVCYSLSRESSLVKSGISSQVQTAMVSVPYNTMHQYNAPQTHWQSNLFHRQPLATTGTGFSQIRCFSCCPTSSVMYIAKSLPRQTHSTDRPVTTSTHPTLTHTHTDYRCTDYRLIIGISRCR